MNYDLRTSTDFGITYFIVDTDKDIKKLKTVCWNMNDRRWVITNKRGHPVSWCAYIEDAIQAPANSTIATDDPYVTILAKEKGLKVLNSLELASMVTGKSIEELRKMHRALTQKDLENGMKEIKKAVEKGEIEVLPTTTEQGGIYGKM
jgi:hypothetical protein